MVAQSTLRWQEAEVRETSDAADGVRRIVVEPDRPVVARPGSHVDVVVDVDGRALRRSYSVVRCDDDGRRWTISVQLARASRGGSVAMHTLEPGERIQVSDPLQSFPLGVGAARYVLVAGGVGVTALVAMATALRRRGADYALVFVGRSRSAMAYLAELEAEHGERLEVHVDDEGTGLDPAALVERIASSELSADTELYMCGPIGLMDGLRHEWAARGLPGPHLRFETFGSSGAWPPEEFRVAIPALGRTVLVRDDASALEALEEAGVEVMSDCRKGECGLCTVRVIDCDGELDHRDVFLSEQQKATDTSILVCVSRVAGGDRATGGAGPRTLTIDRP